MPAISKQLRCQLIKLEHESIYIYIYIGNINVCVTDNNQYIGIYSSS